MSIINDVKNQLKKNGKESIIVFAEGWNETIQNVAINLKKDNIIKPILIFNNESEYLHNQKLTCVEKIDISKTNTKKYSDYLYQLRKDKGLSEEEAKKLASQPNYLCSLLVKMNEADGGICGIEYTTKDTLKPALQIIKTSPNSKIVSSILILEKNNETLFFSDVSLVINPTFTELTFLTENAINFIENTLSYQKNKNNYALLSYSTNGSGTGESVDKVKKAYELIKERNLFPDINIFGEIQFDAAYDQKVRSKKVSHLNWTNDANVFIFPNIDAGNISYKILQRCGNYNVTGPIIIGLDKPINDLSRGAGEYEVESLSYITAIQAQLNNSN